MMWNNAGRFVSDSSVPTITQPYNGDNEQDDDDSNSSIPQTMPELTPFLPSEINITRRAQHWGIENPVPATVPPSAPRPLPPRKIENLQELWQDYVQQIFQSASLGMWRMFCAVRRETRVCQTAVLRALQKVVKPASSPKQWPKDRRQLDALVAQAGCFQSRILRVVSIQMTNEGFSNIEFRFVDPLYAWACAAEKAGTKSPLHFQYIPSYSPNQQRLFGSSVKGGEIMRRACERVNSRVPYFDGTIPRGPALIGINWDAGGASKRRSYVPILISVGNTDSASSDTCECIGYVPTLSSKASSNVRRLLVQRCIGAILKIVNKHATQGFTCTLNGK